MPAVRFGLLKVMPQKRDLDYNIDLFINMAEKAADSGVNVLLTCECFLDGYCAAAEDGAPVNPKWFYDNISQPKNGRYIDIVRETALKRNMHVLFGYTEKDGGFCRNAAIFLDGSGNEIGSYYKIMTYDHDSVFEPGRELPVFDTEYGKLGALICADRRWPEHARVLRLKGAKALLLPTYGMYHQKNREWMQTRAYDNEMWVMFCHPRQAFIYDPNGDLAAIYESNTDGLLVHDVDLDMPEPRVNKISGRKPELYGIIGAQIR